MQFPSVPSFRSIVMNELEEIKKQLNLIAVYSERIVDILRDECDYYDKEKTLEKLQTKIWGLEVKKRNLESDILYLTKKAGSLINNLETLTNTIVRDKNGRI